MKRMTRVALMVAVAAAVAGSVSAAEPPEWSETEIYVVNNHLADVHVFAEDAEGRLHNLGRVARGALRAIVVPEEIAVHEYRIKVFPATPAWSPISDDYGIKTSLLDNERDRQVTMWLEADLTQSLVEIHRG